jgi:hypothetical protein
MFNISVCTDLRIEKKRGREKEKKEEGEKRETKEK